MTSESFLCGLAWSFYSSVGGNPYKTKLKVLEFLYCYKLLNIILDCPHSGVPGELDLVPSLAWEHGPFKTQKVQILVTLQIPL